MKSYIVAFAVSVCCVGPALAASCSDIVPSVCRLDPTYNKEAGTGTTYAPPTCKQGSPLANEKAQIQRAFDIAPEKVKEELCRLNRIFVADRNFGLWENPAEPSLQGTRKRSYIAIHEDLIKHDPATPMANALDGVENARLWDVFLALHPGSDPSSWTGHTTTLSSGTDTTPFAVLSVLAHELGHIKWYRDNIDSSLACFDAAFSEPAWDRDTLGAFYQRRWTEMADDPGAHHKVSQGTRHPRDIPGRSGAAHLRNLYVRGFASLLAAMAPDEDFVEMYKLVILKSANSSGVTLASLMLNIVPPTGNFPDFDVLSNANVATNNRAQCVSSLVN
jgi:hypothetical protein